MKNQTHACETATCEYHIMHGILNDLGENKIIINKNHDFLLRLTLYMHLLNLKAMSIKLIHGLIARLMTRRKFHMHLLKFQNMLIVAAQSLMIRM